ncbi:MAG: sulfatase-like hydrolase/transferase [Candidatus Latescibacteria bacterium]|nr:sulfatase-like hydrolase/transferase [Candidatus Latescibacterota bacterium]
MKKPNVLFIFTDDQRFDTISALGNQEIETPNLDRLVKRGTSFTHAHIMGGTSGAVCMPSRAMMLTGRTLFSIEQQGQRIPPEHPAMPEWFRANNYTTAHIGKWHQDRESHTRCFSTGAKIFGFKKKQGWYEACNGHWHIPVHDFDPSGEYAPQGGYNDPEITPFQAPFETTKEQGRHSVEIFSDAAIDFLQQYPDSEDARADKPFFLYLAHIAPHDPRQYPERFKQRYNADTVSLPPNFSIQHPFDNGDMLVRDELLEAHPRRPEAVRQHIADYYALIALIDEQVGRILDALEASGQADNTIIVFSGDNGLAVGQHGLMGKQNLYDHSIRVPLIIAGPGVPENQQTDTWCYLLDLFPTLCQLTGLPTPETVEGNSLVSSIQTPSTVVRDSLHFAYKDIQRAVRKGRFKLIEYRVNGKQTTQLFDLESDPCETANLVAQPQYAETLGSLRQELRRWQTELGDKQEMGTQFWNAC